PVASYRSIHTVASSLHLAVSTGSNSATGLVQSGQDAGCLLEVRGCGAAAGGWDVSAANRLDQSFDAVLGDSVVVDEVHLHDRGLVAGAEAFLFVQGEHAVLGHAFGVGAEDVTRAFVDTLRAEERAREVGAHRDH